MPSVDLFANFSSALMIYFDTAKTRPMRRVIMYAWDEGVSFPCSVQPNQVRRFNNQYPNGLLLTLTSNPTNINQYAWAAGQLSLASSTPLTSGDYLVAYTSGEELFENQPTVSGLPRFFSSSDNVNDRTKIQTIYIFNESSNKRYVDLRLSVSLSLVPNIGLEPSHFSFSLDGTNWVSDTLQLPDIQPNSSLAVQIRCIVPKGIITGNLRDVILSISGFEEEI